MVDYVIIDANPTPIENIARLQPDYFAKGYEYQDGQINPKTQQEIDALAKLRRRDSVHARRHRLFVIASHRNRPAQYRRRETARADGSRGARISTICARIVDRFEGIKVHVVGDTIVDSLTYTTMIGGMTKTPTPSVRFDSRADFVGGAAIVAKHLRAAGAEVTFSTVLGDDVLKDFVLEDLAAAGVKVMPIIDHYPPDHA